MTMCVFDHIGLRSLNLCILVADEQVIIITQSTKQACIVRSNVSVNLFYQGSLLIILCIRPIRPAQSEVTFAYLCFNYQGSLTVTLCIRPIRPAQSEATLRTSVLLRQFNCNPMQSTKQACIVRSNLAYLCILGQFNCNPMHSTNQACVVRIQ